MDILYGNTILYMDCSFTRQENEPLYVGQQNITLHMVYLHIIILHQECNNLGRI
jgi:hypothetical protein